MLDKNWLTSQRLKGLAVLLLLTTCTPILHAQEEGYAPQISQNIPDSPSEQHATASTPAASADPTEAPSSTASSEAASTTSRSISVPSINVSKAFAEAVSKLEDFIYESPSVPEGVKTFLENHSEQVEWTKEHPLHINAFALVFAVLCRMCCGDKPKIPKKKVTKKAPAHAAGSAPAPAPRFEPPLPKQTSKPAATQEPDKNPFERVLEETLRSPATPARDTFVVQSFLRWAAAEPQPAYNWAIGLEDMTLGQRLLKDALLAEEEKDSAAAFELALNTLPAELQEGVIDAIVRQWTRKKPQAAAEKIATLPSNAPVLQTAVAAVIETWAAQDIEAAHRWLVALPINLFRDLALSVFIQQLMLQSPESAAAWVDSIANDQVRQQVTEMVAQKWQAVDAEAANAWLEKATA